MGVGAADEGTCREGAYLMGLQYRRRVTLGDGTYVNLSKSGASVSKRRGRFTVSSRGRVAVRLFKGLRWRGKL